MLKLCIDKKNIVMLLPEHIHQATKKNAKGFHEELRISHSTVSYLKCHGLHYSGNHIPSFEKDQFSFLLY